MSMAVCAVVAFLILGPRPEGVAGAVDVSALPWVNAGINSITAVLLVAALGAIKTGRVALHRVLMTVALGLSGVFLAVYITYHWFSAGPVHYDGPFRGAYLFVLATHVILAAVVPPLALTAWVRGYTGALVAHRRIAPLAFAVWLYVAITGVIIVLVAHR